MGRARPKTKNSASRAIASAPLRCIYCPQPLSPKTKVAHVWPAALGGRLKSRAICCDGCNNATSPMERDVHDALLHPGAALGARSDDGKPLRMRLVLAGFEFELAGGRGLLQPGPIKFDRARKAIVVPLPAGLRRQAERLARAMRSHGLGVDDVDKLSIEPSDEPDPVFPSGPHEYDLSLGARDSHKRVFAKMALELLAYHQHGIALRGELSEARRFVRRGVGSIQSKPDPKSPGSGLLTRRRLPEVYNSVEIWNVGRAVNFRVVFLGALAFTGSLSTEWEGPAFRAAYAFDARDPARTVLSTLQMRGGPPLALWHGNLRDQAMRRAVEKLEAASRALSQRLSPPPREPPSALENLRACVRDELAKLLTHRKRNGVK